MSKGTVVIVRGLPGSGKSTIAKQKYPDAIHLSTDDRVTCRNGNYLWNTSTIRMSHELNQALCKTAIEIGHEVIVVDNTNTTYKEMKPYVELARKNNYGVEILEPETEWKFDVDECHKRNTHNVPKASIQKMKDRWQSTEDIKKGIV